MKIPKVIEPDLVYSMIGSLKKETRRSNKIQDFQILGITLRN